MLHNNIDKQVVVNTKKEILQGLVHKYVRSGSTTYTNENPTYNKVAYSHKSINDNVKEYVNEQAHTNGVKNV